MVSLIIALFGLIAGTIGLIISLTRVRKLRKELSKANEYFRRANLAGIKLCCDLVLMEKELAKYKRKRDDKGRFIKKDMPQT